MEYCCKAVHAVCIMLVLQAFRSFAGRSLRRPACPALLQGSLGERVSAFFIGGNPRLVSEETVHSPGDRFRLQTVARGVVQLQLGEWRAAAGGVAWPQFERHMHPHKVLLLAHQSRSSSLGVHRAVPSTGAACIAAVVQSQCSRQWHDCGAE